MNLRDRFGFTLIRCFMAVPLLFSQLEAVGAGPNSDQGEFPPLLFLHGFTCDPSYWAPQERFFQSLAPVFTPVLPVHPGAQIVAEPTVEGLAEAMLAYAEKAISDRPVVIGHSLGGMVALQMVLKAPEKLRAVVLVDSFPDLDIARKASLGLFGPETPETLSQKIRREMAASREKMIPADRDRLWNSLDAMDVTTRLNEIEIPVLGIYGGREKFEKGEEASFKNLVALDRVSSATVTILPGLGHFPQLERPEDFNALLNLFLRGLPE